VAQAWWSSCSARRLRCGPSSSVPRPWQRGCRSRSRRRRRQRHRQGSRRAPGSCGRRWVSRTSVLGSVEAGGYGASSVLAPFIVLLKLLPHFDCQNTKPVQYRKDQLAKVLVLERVPCDGYPFPFEIGKTCQRIRIKTQKACQAPQDSA